MDVGGKLLAALASKQDVFGFYNANLRSDYFLGDELEAFQWILAHIKSHSAIPQLVTLKSAFPGLPEAVEPIGYYLAKVEERFRHRSINKALMEASELMKHQKTDDTFNLLKTLVTELTLDKYRGQVVDFTTQGALIFKNEYNNAVLGKTGVTFGWETLDSMTMGMFPGDLVSIIGRPGQGKTYKMLYAAHHAWYKQQKNVLFLSMEMNPPPLVQRLTAIHSHQAINDIKFGQLPDPPYVSAGQIYETLLQLKGHPSKLWIIDGNLQSTPSEIFSIAQYVKADAVYIDGAYLLRSENRRLDRYTRVAENTEEIKRSTSILKIPTMASFQFRKPAVEKSSGKKKEKKTPKEYDLDDIGYTDVVAQISSIALGLFQDETVETLKSRRVTVLKGREGARGGYNMNWDFNKMDFSEYVEVKDEQLSHM